MPVIISSGLGALGSPSGISHMNGNWNSGTGSRSQGYLELCCQRAIPQPRMTMHNEELLAKETVFHLRFNWCLEEGLVKLLILCFAILKADDIRVVWDSRVNKHNETLWTSSFI